MQETIDLDSRRKRKALWSKMPTWLPVILALCGVGTAIGILRVPWATVEQLDALEKRLDQKMTNLPAEIVKALKGAKEQ